VRARLPHQCRLLIAGDSIDRDRCPEQRGIGHAERGRAIQHRRQNGAGNAEQRRALLIDLGGFN
jgi:hypothetical protein